MTKDLHVVETTTISEAAYNSGSKKYLNET
jgi:hypothetical protein